MMNNPIPRDQAIDLLQELISKASVRLHAAMRKPANPSHTEVGQVPKAATSQQMQRLLDRLGSEAYKELEQKLGLSTGVSKEPLMSSPSGSLHALGRVSQRVALGEGDQQGSSTGPVQGVDGAAATGVRQTHGTVGPGRTQLAADAALSGCTVPAQAMDRLCSNMAALPEYHSAHNVHQDQRIEFLGPSKRPGSSSRPACFDVHQGYRQRGASQHTDRNLQEHESGVAVCWVPGGRHQGTFNRVGAIQAAAGISRKTCTGSPGRAAKFRSASARPHSKVKNNYLECGNFSPLMGGCRSGNAPAFPPASHALASTESRSASCQPEHAPTVHPARPARLRCSGTLDSPEARLSFDLRAARLMDPAPKFCTKPRRRSCSNSQGWHTKPSLLSQPVYGPACHRRRWLDLDALSQHIDDPQQGNGQLGLTRTVVTGTLDHAPESFRTCATHASGVVSEARSASSTTTANVNIASSRLGPCMAQHPGSGTAGVDEALDVGDMDEDLKGSLHMLGPAENVPTAQACITGPGTHITEQGIASSCAPTERGRVPGTCMHDAEAHGGTPGAHCQAVEVVTAPEAKWQNGRDAVHKPVEGETATLGSPVVNDDPLSSQQLAQPCEPIPPPSMPRICIDHASATDGAHPRRSPAQESMQYHPLALASGSHISPCFHADRARRMRQHLDKASELVDHLSQSTELMQRLHHSARSPADDVQRDSADITTRPVLAADCQLKAPLGSCRAGCLTTKATAAAVDTWGHPCPKCAPWQHLDGHALDYAVLKRSGEHAPLKGSSPLPIPGRQQGAGWELGLQSVADDGRSRSLPSTVAGMMPMRGRPSDAIVNRVDEIHKSVERLRQAHLGAMRSSGLSTHDADLDDKITM